MALPDPFVTYNGEVVPQSVQRDLDYLDGTTTKLLTLVPLVGVGNPNGVVTASPPSLYLNLSGGAGTTLWVKESGVQTNTGWIGK